MSEYASSTGFQGSLVNDSASDCTQAGIGNTDYTTRNYPTSGDSTASGGYGSPSNTWSDRAQRGRPEDVGLIDQSTNGGSLAQEVRNGDAAQGEDAGTRRDFAREPANANRNDSWEGRKEAEQNLAQRFSDARGQV